MQGSGQGLQGLLEVFNRVAKRAVLSRAHYRVHASMRPDEGHNGQLCDWWPECDSQEGHLEFAGGAALNISQQKNDAGRKGAHKRFGKSKDPALNF